MGQLPTSEAVEYVLDLPPPAEEEGSTLDGADAKKPKASSSVAKGGCMASAVLSLVLIACLCNVMCVGCTVWANWVVGRRCTTLCFT